MSDLEKKNTKTPKRPANVPESAIWVPTDNEWADGQLKKYVFDGATSWYRKDGSIINKTVYKDGKANGFNERFHPDGSWSERGNYLNNKAHGLLEWQKSDNETKENSFFDLFPNSIWSIKTEFVHGLPYNNRAFDRDGNELIPSTGEAQPERPESVDPEASYVADGSFWFRGLGANDEKTRSGLWKWWNADGKLRQATLYSKGSAYRNIQLQENGSYDEYFTAPDRKSTLCRRFFDAQGIQLFNNEAIPERPEGIPETAFFSHFPEGWVVGFDENWDPYEDSGAVELYERNGKIKERTIWRNGTTVEEQRFRKGQLSSTITYDANGNKILETEYFEDGTFEQQIARTYDDKGLKRIKLTDCNYPKVKLQGSRSDNGLMNYDFYNTDGIMIAKGSCENDIATGEWEFIEEGKKYQITPSPDIEVELSFDFDPMRILGVTLLESEGAQSKIPELTGAEEINWEDTPSCYDEFENVPNLLRALASEVVAVRSIALGEIYSETLHQGTVYMATARVVPFMIRLLEHPNTNNLQILKYINAVIQAASEDTETSKEMVADEDLKRMYEEDGERDYGAEYEIAVKALLQAFRKGFSSIAATFETASDKEKSYIIELARFAGDEGYPFIKQVSSQITERDMLAVLVHAQLKSDKATAADAHPWLKHTDALIRFVAAISIAENLKDAAPEEIVAVLETGIEASEEIGPAFANLPFADGSLISYAALGLSDIRNEAAMQLAPLLASRLNDLDYFSLDIVSYALLTICFGDGTPPYAPGFVEVLNHFANCPKIDGYSNFSQHASNYGLPNSTNAYKSLVEELQNHPDPAKRMQAHFKGEQPL